MYPDYPPRRSKLTPWLLLAAIQAQRQRPRRQDEPGLLYVLLFWGLVALWLWWKWS